MASHKAYEAEARAEAASLALSFVRTKCDHRLRPQLAALPCHAHLPASSPGADSTAQGSATAGLSTLQPCAPCSPPPPPYGLSVSCSAASLARDGQRGRRAGTLCESAGCTPPLGLLGDGSVTDKNLIQYLGMLEQRAYEIIQVTSCPCCGWP